MADRANATGSWKILDDALNDPAVAGQTIRTDLTTINRNNIRGKRFEAQRESVYPFRQVYLDTGRTRKVTLTDGTVVDRRIYVIVDGYDPAIGIFSMKAFQLATTPRQQVLDAIDEAFTKHRADNFAVADVPSRPAALSAQPLQGQLHVEFPEQFQTWTGPVRDEACARAAALRSFGLPMKLVDANGVDLCA